MRPRSPGAPRQSVRPTNRITALRAALEVHAMGKGLVYAVIGTLALVALAIVSTLRWALVVVGFLVLALLASVSVSLLMGLIVDDRVASAAASVAFVVTLVGGPLITLSVRKATRG